MTAPLVNDGNIIHPPKDHSTPEHVQPNGHPHSKSSVLHRSLHHSPLKVLSATGNHLHLSNGQSILDATGGAAVSCLGHSNTRVQTAITSQLSQVSYCHSLFYSTSPAEQLAAFLTESTGGEMTRAFIVSSGSEAVEAALKMARQYHLEKVPREEGRTRFISRRQSYHGTTLGALGVGGHVARRALFEPLLAGNLGSVSPCYEYRGGEWGSVEEYVGFLERELDEEFRRVGGESVAAFIAEPVVGAALGCVSAVKGYFQAVRRVCDRYGALLILDEIMSGCGRVGPEPSEKYPQPLHAWQDPELGGGIVPDLMTMGKGLGGGYMPVAAMLVSRRVVEVLNKGSGAFSHGQTYQGHPLACRAALEVQKIIKEDNLVANVRAQGKLLGILLQERLGQHPAVGNVRGKGLFWGIEFVRNKKSKTAFEPEDGVAMGVHELGMQEPFNISLYPGSGSVDGKTGDHILLAPAYNITAAEIIDIVDRTVRVIEQFFRGFKPTDKTNGHTNGVH